MALHIFTNCSMVVASIFSQKFILSRHSKILLPADVGLAFFIQNYLLRFKSNREAFCQHFHLIHKRVTRTVRH